MGESAIVVVVPEVDDLVREWRERDVPVASRGVPPHVTVLYPFLDPAAVDDGVVAELAHHFAGVDAFDFTFARVGRFPSVVYLMPEPAGVFLGLTRALVDRWPGHPPYGGRFPDTVPHLTVSAAEDGARRDEVADALARRLPVRVRAREASLWVSDESGRWTQRAALPFGPP